MKTNDEMIAHIKRQLHERVETLLSQGQYTKAAEAVSVLEALEKAGRLLRNASVSTFSQPSAKPTASLSSESGPSFNTEPEYPYFVRAGEDLVKVGWSAKNEEEYLHRAPESSVAAVCEAVERAASGHTAFGRDDLGGIATSDGDAIPDYQVYLCLSWLRWAGLLNRVQRGKYSVPNLRRFTGLWSRAWAQLPLAHPQAD